jgi:mRNA-degrading endonuclease YafQ of YafQ-DinJ toxin-antitoxin module
LRKRIRFVEENIETSLTYEKKLHEKEIRGKYAGFMHARITRNLRLIYTWDKDTQELVYRDIIDHVTFDQEKKK